MTPLHAAQLCQQLYAGDAGFTIYQGDATCDVYVGVVEDGLDLYIVFRGSTTFLDFWRDFRFCLVTHPGIGAVEDGFYQGLSKVFTDLMPLMGGKRVYLIGHSLGGARAYLFAGLMVLHYFDVAGIFTFGSPRPGGEELHSILYGASIPICAVENHLDPVPEIPLTVPEFPYCPAFDLAQLHSIDVRPKWDDDWGPVAPHRIQFYVEGAKKL